MKLTKIEIKYIELTYLGVTEYSDLEKELKRSRKKIINMQKKIFKTLSANSWYNAIRISFELNILNKGDYRKLNIEAEINKTAKIIRKIKANNLQNDVDVKLEIFSNLVRLYNKREYDLLLRNSGLEIEFNKKVS